MNILHLESSQGWGGQEIRILKESQGMQNRNHKIFLAAAKGGEIVGKAREMGNKVYELNFRKWAWIVTLFKLIKIIWQNKIDIVNTHSSLDAWIGGLAAKLMRKKIVRTRHLSTPIKHGINSRIIYGKLAHFVVTTCEQTKKMLEKQIKTKIKSIPTGINFKEIKFSEENKRDFLKKLKISKNDFLVGTLCIIRRWKGIDDLVEAANILKDEKNLKWIVIGKGFPQKYIEKVKKLGLEKKVLFPGYLENPFIGIDSLDIFLALSTANEGVPQACLQAAFLEKPIIGTTVGGIPEVCIEGETAMIIPPFAPQKIVEKILILKNDKKLREKLGKNVKNRVEKTFTLEKTLDEMEKVYDLLMGK